MTQQHQTPSPIGFSDLGLDNALLLAVQQAGFKAPTDIQKEAIPVALSGRDVVGQAATGTGKTAAFALPILQSLLASGQKSKNPRALVLVPTRELCLQVAESIKTLGSFARVSTTAIYGGQSYRDQFHTLKRGVDVVVATPGRAIDLIDRGALILSEVTYVVLDEADEMLDMGFVDDIEEILSHVGEQRQVMLFSATLPPRITAIIKKYLSEPEFVRVAKAEPKEGEKPKVTQEVYVVTRPHKEGALLRLLDAYNPKAAIIFCRTREEVDGITQSLSKRNAEALHGGISQAQREKIIQRLRDGGTSLLVATDVAARGLDIDHLTHVINFDLPSSPETYVHRIGRVGRAGREGVAISLAEPRQKFVFKHIEKLTGQRLEMPKLPSAETIKQTRVAGIEANARELLAEKPDLTLFKAAVARLATEELSFEDIAALALCLVYKQSGFSEAALRDIPTFSEKPAKKGGGQERRGRDRDHGDRDHGNGSRDRGGRDNGPRGDVALLKLNIGRSAGISPRDLVGAIAGESGLPGRMIGSIKISDDSSTVEIPKDALKKVKVALQGTRIKGKRVTALI